MLSIINRIKNPSHTLAGILRKVWFLFPNDKSFLKTMYRLEIGKKLNLTNPNSFNEKLQWLKLYDRKPDYIKMVDKISAKDYVASIIGDKYIIPTYGVWSHYDEIDFSSLPEQFVLKTNHSGGGSGVVLCFDKNKFDHKNARKKLEASLRKNSYNQSKEWPYKNIEPRILAEAMLSEGTNSNNEFDLPDYKFMCFNGRVKCIFTCTNRYSSNGLCVTFFDPNWEMLPFSRNHPIDNNPIAKPKSLELMIELAEKISHNICFARIDFYQINDMPYFGEITLYPGGGWEKFEPEEWDEKLGNWITLPSEKNDQVK